MPKSLNIVFTESDTRLAHIYRSELIEEYKWAKMKVSQSSDVETLQYWQGVAELSLKLLRCKGFESLG